MKRILFIAFFIVSQLTIAQNTATVTGTLTDKESNNEPLPFANVLIKGTTNGGTTDFDGKYTIKVQIGRAHV